MADVQVKCPKCEVVITVSEFADRSTMTCRKCGSKLVEVAAAPAPPPPAPPAPTPAAAPAPKPPAASAPQAPPAAPKIKPSLKKKEMGAQAVAPVAPPVAAAPAVPRVKTSLKFKEQEPEAAAAQAAAGTGEPTKWQASQDALKEINAQAGQRKGVNHHLISWIIFIVLAGSMAYLRYGGGYLGTPEGMSMTIQYGPYVVGIFHLFIVLKAFKDSVFQGILCLLVPFYSFYYIFGVSDDFYSRAIIGGVLVGIGQESFLEINRQAQEYISVINRWIARGGS